MNRLLRGHDFYPPQSRLERIPALYATDGTTVGKAGKIVYEHYFSAAGDFYVCELNQDTGEAFGIYKNQYGDTELTYVSLPELESRLAQSNGLPVIFERDLDFEPVRASTAMPEQLGGRAIERLSRPEFERLEVAYERYREHAVKAHDPSFDVMQIESHSARARELYDDFMKVESELGIFVHTDHDSPSFRSLNSTNRDDWTDVELERVQEL